MPVSPAAPPLGHGEINSAEAQGVRLKCEVQNRSKVECVGGAERTSLGLGEEGCTPSNSERHERTCVQKSSGSAWGWDLH